MWLGTFAPWRRSRHPSSSYLGVINIRNRNVKQELSHVTNVTDESATPCYPSNISMRALSQAVAVVLLIFLGSMPMLGGVSYQKQMNVPLCSSHGGSMMAAVGSVDAQASGQPSGSSPYCCKMIPNRSVEMLVPNAPRALTQVMLVGEAIDAPISRMTLPVIEEHTQSNRWMRGRSQCILCNYRI